MEKIRITKRTQNHIFPNRFFELWIYVIIPIIKVCQIQCNPYHQIQSTILPLSPKIKIYHIITFLNLSFCWHTMVIITATWNNDLQTTDCYIKPRNGRNKFFLNILNQQVYMTSQPRRLPSTYITSNLSYHCHAGPSYNWT